MSTRLAKVVEFMIGCGLVFSTLLALRSVRPAPARSQSGVNPSNIAASRQQRQEQASALFGR